MFWLSEVLSRALPSVDLAIVGSGLVKGFHDPYSDPHGAQRVGSCPTPYQPTETHPTPATTLTPEPCSNQWLSHQKLKVVRKMITIMRKKTMAETM